MGSLLGNYVHLSGQGYLNAGTYRDETKWEKSTGVQSDSDAMVFDKYIYALQEKYQSALFSLNAMQLQKWETEYNNQRAANYAALVKMNKEGQLPANFWESVIKTANVGKDIKASDIIPYLQFTEDNESIDVDKTIEALMHTSKASKIQKPSGTNKVLNSTIEGWFTQIQGIIKLSEEPLVKKQYNKLRTIWEAYNHQRMSLIQLEDKLKITNKEKKAYNHIKSVPPYIAEFIRDKLNNLAFLVFNYNDIIKITASFAEIMGTIISYQEILPNLALSAIIEMLSEAEGAQITTSSFGADKDTIIKLDQSKLQQQYEKQISKNNKFQKIIKTDNGTYAINAEFETQQKADFTLFYDNMTPVGISMKSTDMAQEFYKNRYTGKLEESDINIHSGTSLYAFLLGVEKENLRRNIHNHFLNVFAQPPDETGFGQYRKSAEEAMILSLLYSGLSGRGLGKIKGFADILAVEDKTKTSNGLPRVKFYNITTILDDIASNIEQKKKYLKYSPNFSALTLRNAKQDTIQKRLTMLLLEARGIKLSMRIKKNYLNSLYNVQTFAT